MNGAWQHAKRAAPLTGAEPVSSLLVRWGSTPMRRGRQAGQGQARRPSRCIITHSQVCISQLAARALVQCLEQMVHRRHGDGFVPLTTAILIITITAGSSTPPTCAAEPAASPLGITTGSEGAKSLAQMLFMRLHTWCGVHNASWQALLPPDMPHTQAQCKACACASPTCVLVEGEIDRMIRPSLSTASITHTWSSIVR